MWLERTIVKTNVALPGILRWCEVSETSSFKMSPIEVAIDTVREMNRNLERLIEQYLVDARQFGQILMMKLNGVINAEVQGGLAKYEEVRYTK